MAPAIETVDKFARHEPLSVLLDLAGVNYWNLIDEIGQICKVADNATLIRGGL